MARCVFTCRTSVLILAGAVRSYSQMPPIRYSQLLCRSDWCLFSLTAGWGCALPDLRADSPRLHRLVGLLPALLEAIVQVVGSQWIGARIQLSRSLADPWHDRCSRQLLFGWSLIVSLLRDNPSIVQVALLRCPGVVQPYGMPPSC